MLISIDHGNYAIKTPHTCFLSGVTEFYTKPHTTAEIMEFGGRYWTLTDTRIPYMRDKTNNDRYFVLTLFAIAKELILFKAPESCIKVELAVGLPPAHYSILKDRFAGYFLRNEVISFVYNGKFFSIVIEDVLVYPQSFAAAMTLSDEFRPGLCTYLIEIGGYITNILAIREKEPHLQLVYSLESGVITMNHDIIRRLGAFRSMHLHDERICAVLRKQTTGFSEETQRAIREGAEQFAFDLLDQFRELHIDLRSRPAVFVGGGSMLLKEHIQSSDRVVHADFLEEQKANAQGYLILAERHYQGGANA